jgi:hypothetical protein
MSGERGTFPWAAIILERARTRHTRFIEISFACDLNAPPCTGISRSGLLNLDQYPYVFRREQRI